MKLYTVNASYVLVVLAPDVEAAIEVAFDTTANPMFDQSPDDVEVHEVTELGKVPPDWRTAIPFSEGEGDDKTVAEILADQAKCS